MTTKDYLSQPFVLNRHINLEMERLHSLRELASNTTAPISDMPRSDSPNLQRMEAVVAKIVDLEKQVDRDIDTLVDLKAELIEVIAQVPNKTQRDILTARYLEFKSWSKISEALSLDKRWVQRQHGRAIEKMSKIMKLTDS